MDTQSEDYKVLQAMRTEINGLVESKNRLDLEIQELQRQKAQAELETSSVQTKLSDVSGEWKKQMDALIAKQAEISNGEVALAISRQQFEAEQKEGKTAIEYTLASVKNKEVLIQQVEADTAKRADIVRASEKQLGVQQAALESMRAKVDSDRLHLVELEKVLDTHSRVITDAQKELTAKQAELVKEAERVRQQEGQIAKESGRNQEDLEKREERLRQQEGMLADRERELAKQQAVMDTRITKSEAVEVNKTKTEIEQKKQELAREKSIFEIRMQNAKLELFDVNENITRAKQELSLVEGKIAEIAAREKGVADSEAGLAAKEKQLMFEIAKFKKRVSDAKMEETINESR